MESLRRVLARLGVDGEAAAEEVATLFFRTRNETTPVYDDVREALTGLRAAGLTLIAASNGNLDLAVPGLDGYFDATLFADEAKHLKPRPALLRAGDRARGRAAGEHSGGGRPAGERLRAGARRPACTRSCSTAGAR